MFENKDAAKVFEEKLMQLRAIAVQIREDGAGAEAEQEVGEDEMEAVRQKREMLSFFACDQLDLSTEERRDLLESSETDERVAMAVEKFEALVKGMQSDYEAEIAAKEIAAKEEA